MVCRGTLTLIGLLLNLYIKAGIPLSLAASKTCDHHFSTGSFPCPYRLHSRYQFPSIKSGRNFSLVCSKILLSGNVRFNSSLRELAISLSKAAPLFLELVIIFKGYQQTLHLSERSEHHQDRLNFPIT